MSGEDKLLFHSDVSLVSLNAATSSAISFNEQLEDIVKKNSPDVNCKDMYNTLCSDVHTAIRKAFPRCVVMPFGSTYTGLATNCSDVDIFIDLQSQKPAEDAIKIIKSQIYRSQHKFEKILYINAKTPIVKLKHKATGLNCDISCKSALGIKNSQLIKYYVNLDPRIKQFLILIKHWAGFFNLTGNQNISNYALTLKALFYLQQMENPLIHPVAYLKSKCSNHVLHSGWECNFELVPAKVRSLFDNRTVADLFRGFFHYYSKFDYKNEVICLLLGRTVPKSAFADTTLLPDEMAAYVAKGFTDVDKLQVDSKSGTIGCIQDPFVLNHNVVQHVGSSFMEKLVPSYVRASQVCDEVTDDKHLLTELFDQKNSIIPPPSSTIINVYLNSSNVIGFPIYFETIGKSKEQFFLDTYDFVLMILTEVFKLDVKVAQPGAVDELNSSPSKKAKVEFDSSAIESCSESLQTVELHCKGVYDVTYARSKLQKTFEQPMGQLKKELLITDAVIAELEKIGATTVIDFSCKFVPQIEPQLQVQLVISDIATRHKMFRNWATCLRDRFFKLYKVYFQEVKIKVPDDEHLLTKLFDQKNSIIPPQAATIDKVYLISKNVIGFPMYFESIGKSKEQFFMDTYEFVLMILTRVFKLDVKVAQPGAVDELNPSPSKKAKVEFDSSAIESCFKSLQTLELHCKGNYDVTYARNKLKKSFEGSMGQLKMELLITDAVIAELEKIGATTVIDFSCKLVPKIEPQLQVQVVISDMASRPKIFNNWATCLRDRMFKLYNVHFQEFKFVMIELEKQQI